MDFLVRANVQLRTAAKSKEEQFHPRGADWLRAQFTCRNRVIDLGCVVERPRPMPVPIKAETPWRHISPDLPRTLSVGQDALERHLGHGFINLLLL